MPLSLQNSFLAILMLTSRKKEELVKNAVFFARIHYSLAVAKGLQSPVTFSFFKRQLPALKTTLKL